MPTINTDNRNKYALITGGTSGIGYELAKCFAKDGYSLLLVARDAGRLQEVSDELKQQFGVEVTPIQKDLFMPHAAREIYEEVQRMGIVINALVNDAGQGQRGEFLETDLQRELDLIQLNISSLVALTKYFVKDMALRGEGRVLQLGSEAGKSPMPLLAVYAATKAFVISFSVALANELKDKGVSITVLLPGATDTDFFHKADATETITYREKELLDPADVARDGYESLMSGDSKIISGGKTKMHVYMSDMLPDSAAATMSRKQMELSSKGPQEGRTQSDHPASRIERDNISHKTGIPTGDSVSQTTQEKQTQQTDRDTAY